MRELPVEVSRVLETLLPAIRQALGGRVVSIVRWGSSVLGDVSGLYAIEHGRQTSKSNAGRWLAQSHPAWTSVAETSVRVSELGEAPDERHIRPADVERFTVWAARLGRDWISSRM